MQVNDHELLEGKKLAAKIQEEIKLKVDGLMAQKKDRPTLASINITGNSSSDWYIGQQEKLAAKLGIAYQKVPMDSVRDQNSLIRKIQEINLSQIHGVFLAMPLPKNFDADQALLALDPKKDVEGVHPTSLGLIVLRKSKLIPPTAFAAFKLIESTGIELKGKKAVIVGQSAIVGRPLQLLLGERRVTTIVCNTGTSSHVMEEYLSEADIVVGCAGQPGLIKGSWINPGSIVIDVGTTEVNGKLAGDVDFDEAKMRARFITPVPGGVGPLTVTMLMQNLMQAYDWQELAHGS